MSDKQSLLQAVDALREDANWAEITDALLALLARRGETAEFARLYRSQLTAEHLAEYANPNGAVPFDDVISELECRTPKPERS